MKTYVCDVCGWVYDEAAGDPDNGIAPGTKFEDLLPPYSLSNNIADNKYINIS